MEFENHCQTDNYQTHTHTQERRQFMNILDPVLNQGFRLRGIDIAGKRLDRI